MSTSHLILKRASGSRSSGQWSDEGYDVLADGIVIGRVMKAAAALVGTPWLWTLAFGQHEDRTPTHGYEPTREAAMRPCPKGSRGQSKLPNVRIVLLVHARAMIPYYERERVSSSGHLHHIQRVPSLAVELAEAGHRCPVKDECMRQKSQLVLPCDPGYTAHREAGKRRQETREWLRRRERAIAAPSIVPEKPEEKLRVERQRSHSH